MVFFHFVFCLKSRGHVTSFKIRSGYGMLSFFFENFDTGAFTYDVRCFSGIFDPPTYPKVLKLNGVI